MVATQCPACGAALTFAVPGSYVAICSSCQSAISRLNMADLGKVADIAVSQSPLQLGLSGVYRQEPFTLVGHTQLRNEHGGQWEEWYAHFERTGRWGWVSEAQGHFYLLFEHTPQQPLPAADTLHAGENAMVEGKGFTVQERGVARYTGAAGELPFAVEDRPYPFVDLVGPGAAFASINLDIVPRLYMGHRVSLVDLGIHKAPAADRPAPTVASRQLACPQCGGALQLHAGNLTEHVGCPYCGSLLDVRSEEAAIIHASKEVSTKPLLPLGLEGELFGTRWRLLGFMNRGTVVDGVSYQWDEYLLYEPAQGFRWLVQNDTHWSFVESIADEGGERPSSLERHLHREGRDYRRFQSCDAEVLCVVGEFYWRVQVGDRTAIIDYVAPPYVRSSETANDETIWSLGTYVPAKVIAQAFKTRLYESDRTVGPNQPWRHHGVFKIMGLLMAAAVVLYILEGLFAHTVASESYSTLTTQQTVVLESLNLSSWRNVAVTVHTDGTQLALDGSLVNDATGYALPFGVDVEDSGDTDVYLPGPSQSGTYTLRFLVRDMEWTTGSVRIKVAQGVPNASALRWFLGCNMAWGIIMLLARSQFETRRWENSDG